ncbi:hypothetical protein E4U03_08750 [Rothia nasimurium]|uniref:histidine kinase n=2 Tax=Rothia nasimurium TaxID=85336 RepID=A0A4Y9F4I9_9MICC|nr:hypothetical protein E4U03_08750 [Rothia nasimurium]
MFFPRSPARHTRPFPSDWYYSLPSSRQPSRQLPTPAYRLLRAHHPLGVALLHRLPALCIRPMRAHTSQLGLLQPGICPTGLLHSCHHLFVRSHRHPLAGIFLLAISHIAGEIITAYALQQPFNLFALSVSLFLFIALPLALRISWEQRRTLAQEYADYKEQVAESNRALARELHDTVARHISVIGLTTGQGLDTTDPSGKDAALHTIEEHTHKALTDMHLLIRTTRSDADPTALSQTSAPTINLTQTLAQARKDLTDHGFTLHENITITEADLPDGVRPTFHKLIQEICHNAKKYAQPGCTITVTAKPNLTGVTVITSNPAAPSNPKKHTRGTGYGLVGIGERIRALGGTMHYGVTDTTWNLTILLPLAIA